MARDHMGDAFGAMDGARFGKRSSEEPFGCLTIYGRMT
jgi:hypothetical protein